MINGVCFIGKYDKAKLQILLEEIEYRFPEVVWSGGNKPSRWNPLDFDDEKYVAVEIRDGKLSYLTDRSKEVYEEDLRTYMKGYTLITFDEFMNDGQDIQNEMDVSFLYGG